jgi:hypothetical protein
MVTGVGLVKLQSVAVTCVDVFDVVPLGIVAVPSLIEVITSVFEMFHVTSFVTS